ncbi:MAG: YggS family pyridoxal phosphate-dependent enzyme [bacterium]|nr:YggS family pyridoxal phosphate-dependent enzyme [bacterium]
MELIKENIEKIREKIHKACAKTGRDPDSVVIVGACKHNTPERIEAAYNYGIKVMGENIVQDALVKYDALKHTDIKWHMIGHLQTNKVKKILEMASMIQSVDSLYLAEEINKRASRKIPVLIEVNTSEEVTKYGTSAEQVIPMLKQIAVLENIKISGLMTIGPLEKDPCPAFKLLRGLKEKIESENIPGVSMEWLSMGMSDDYELAIEEGANIVRLGRVIFGERKK